MLGGEVTVDLERRQAELVDLRARIGGAARDIVEDGVDSSELSSASGDQHLGDHASEMVERELDEGLEENADELVGAIDAALARIDDGTYGRCARCDEPIPEARLDALPYAVLCVPCKQIEERG